LARCGDNCSYEIVVNVFVGPGPDLGEGKLGSCPGASTTKGPPQKISKKLLPKET